MRSSPLAVAGPGVWFYYGSNKLGGKAYARVTFLRATANGGRSCTTMPPNLGVTGVQSLVFATVSDGWAVVHACGGFGCQGTGWLVLFTSGGGHHFIPVRPPG